ncbi:VOC family protein [soil metagenome]
MLSNKAFSSYSVNDLSQAQKFYADILGLKVKAEEYMLHLYVANNYEVMLYLKPDHKPATFTVLNFVVKDIEATVDELTQKGVRFEKYEGEIETDEKGIHRDEMATIAWFKDPAGNVLAVIQTE